MVVFPGLTLNPGSAASNDRGQQDLSRSLSIGKVLEGSSRDDSMILLGEREAFAQWACLGRSRDAKAKAPPTALALLLCVLALSGQMECQLCASVMYCKRIG